MRARRCLHRPASTTESAGVHRDDSHDRGDSTGAIIAVSRPAWVLLPEEARVRGFKNALALRRWCARHQVALRRDGKMLWVRPADVDAAVGVLPIRSTTPAVMASVEAIKARHAR